MTFLISFFMLGLIVSVYAQVKTGSDQAQIKPGQCSDTGAIEHPRLSGRCVTSLGFTHSEIRIT